MDRLFLDANILFSAAYQPSSGMLRFWRLKRVELVTSQYAIDEANRNLARNDQRARLLQLASALEIIHSVTPQLIPVDLPEKDRPILWAAVSARATHLITGDFRHFGMFFDKKILSVTILSPSQYLKRR